MEIHPVLKNNSLHLDGLVLYSGEFRASPNFYMQDYYKRYREGEEVDELAEEIYTKWSDMTGVSFLDAPELSYDTCRDFIFFRLVNRVRNQELLEEIPFVPVFDLAVIFYYLVSSREDGIQSIRINNHIMEMWELDEMALFALAKENTPRLFPASYRPLGEVLDEYLFPGPTCVEMMGDMRQPYLLTNSKGVNGASVLIYAGQLEEIAQIHQNNFYILPSSIHELLIMVEDETEQTEKHLLQMVREVNREFVGTEEYLSDNIYFYDVQKNAIKIVSEA
jgi:hypothetical protein